MRHLRAIINLVAIVLIVLATIRLSTRPDSTHTEAADSPSILSRRVRPLEFHGLAFDDAAERLGRAAGVEILIDDPSMEVIISTANVSLKSWDGMTLDAALAALVQSSHTGLRYYADGGRVRIMNGSKTPPVVTRIYDVRDLWRLAIEDVPPDFDRPRLEEGPFYPAGAVNARPNSSATTLPSATKSRQQQIEDAAMYHLGYLVMQSLPGLEEYSVNGGVSADLHAVDGRLIVTQTAEGHRRISQLLKLIRQMQASPVDGRRD
ncbi:MAG TPA: hypothetical protein VH370_22050 [Humisphaera sp.]|nr:hypothetical protein [Humisphaera sp.]